MHRNTFPLVAALLAVPLPSSALDFLVETDPATFALKGAAVHVRVRSAAHPGWTVGAGTYALDFPSPMVDLVEANRDEDWEVRIQPGFGLFVDHSNRPDGRGMQLGLQVGMQRYEASAPGRKTGDGYWNLLVMPRAGWEWHPWNNGFYVFPWAGLGWTTTVAGDAGDFHVAPLVPFATLHAGWEF
ncbi:MAG: hypothetical protein H6686_13020 [Fibrobacteria bacterium]|nr:hypothetical protein [Fibrobacteria bacterium]